MSVQSIDLGGCRLLIESSPALPLVHVTGALTSGALEDPAGKEGLTRLTARAMRRTGGGLTQQQLDTRIDSLGGSLGADVSHSTVSFNGTVIARNLDAFLDLMIDVLARPGFSEEELALLRRETEAELIEARDNDRALARRWFSRKMFAGHPYARSVSGHLTTVPTMTAGDVRALYQRTWTRENVVLSFSGDIDAAHARASAERLLEALGSGPRLADQVTDPTGPRGRSLIHRLELFAVPHLEPFVGALHDAVHRLHRRVGEIRKIVVSADHPANIGQRGRSVAVLAGDEARRVGQLVVAGQNFVGAQLEGSAVVPFHHQRIDSRRPE